MEYNHFFRGTYFFKTEGVNTMPDCIKPQGFKVHLMTAGNQASNLFHSWLPSNTSPKLWTILVGITVPVLCYTGYKMWNWVDDLRKRHQNELKNANLYEYKYLKELDDMLQLTLNDVEHPEMANMDTIKVGRHIFPLEVFQSFTRNFRKKMIRRADTLPIVKRVPVPAEEFDWIGSYVDDMVPVGASRDPLEGKKVIMRYDNETESFWWYCDNPSVQYKYLETVARKYVCDFNRIDVFVDIREQLKKSSDDLKKRVKNNGCDDDNSEKVGKDEKSINRNKIYAKFKSYNKKASNGKQIILKAKSNRYSYKGKIEDYERSMLLSNADAFAVTNTNTNNTENVSWSEWKNNQLENWK